MQERHPFVLTLRESVFIAATLHACRELASVDGHKVAPAPVERRLSLWMATTWGLDTVDAAVNDLCKLTGALRYADGKEVKP